MVLALTPRKASAYAELVRHNYPNCTACHVSPSGGGVLTKYGRELSSAIVSIWGTENAAEAKFAYGLVELPGWMDAMGMFRELYLYRNTPQIQEGRTIYMQGDLEAALHFGPLTFDGMLGYQNPESASSFGDHLLSRRHYVAYRPTDEWSLRFGRFFPNYGINTPDHVIPTRQDLGWDYARAFESYNLEAAYIGETWNVFLTANFGRFDQPDLQRETGEGATVSASLADHHKVGASYFFLDGPQTKRQLMGPWAVLGFTSRFYLLSELDFQRQEAKSDGSAQWGAVNYQKLAYEVTQGALVYVTQDYSRLSFADPLSLRNSFGLGVQVFPRPHFELNLQWQKLKIAALQDEYTDYAWASLNIYL
jgi:hypothetical protein